MNLSKPAHRNHREDERGDEADGEHREVSRHEQVAVLVARVHRRADHGRHGQEERELGGGLARQAEQQAADDRRAGARGARNHRQALGEADFQGVFPGDVIDGFGMHFMLTLFGPQHDDPAHDQCRGHGDRVEQVVVNQVGENHPQYHGRQEGDQQVRGKAPRTGLGRQTDDHVENLPAKLPHHRQDRPELDNDVERHGPLATEVEQVGDNNLVPGTGNGQKLRQPFYNAKNQSLKGSPKIHQSPKRLCADACPVSIFQNVYCDQRR